MINDYMKSVLKEMAGLIVDLETQREHIEAAFVEPDVCADCGFYRRQRSDWYCGHKKPPFGRLLMGSESKDKLCCIHFEQREVAK